MLRFPLRFLLTACLVFPTLAQAQPSRPPLIPQPREFESRPDLALSHGVRIVSETRDQEDRFTAKDLADGLKDRGVRMVRDGRAVSIYLLRDSSPLAARLLRDEGVALSQAMRPEGYVLFTRHNDLFVIGHTSAGLFYGAQTAKQLVTSEDGKLTLHGCKVRDWPAMRYRGVDDDLSRGPVPTLEFQEKQIRTFAEYKINIYSPYFENTMQYASAPLPALPGGSMSPQDAKALVEYAKHYHVLIIPEQEAFGHLHKVLNWQKYAQLAETPGGSVLAPGQPGSIRLITQWFDELATDFPGPFLHIGADETFELGEGQTADEVKKRGLGAVYIDFLNQIYQALEPLHRRLLFWGDIAMNDPALVPHLPKDMIAVAWHYEPEPGGFQKWLSPYVNAGMETWVSPGVNNWNRVYPNFNLGLSNIQGFIADGQKMGSTGALNTVWNDDGEGLFLEDWYGILFGAAAAWQPGTTDIPQFEQEYGQVFHGDGSGKVNQAQLALMEAQKLLMSAGLDDARDYYFWLDPWSPQGQQVDGKLRNVGVQVRLDAERALTLLDEARRTENLRESDALDAIDLGARRIDFLIFKYQTADQIADSYRKAYRDANDPQASKTTSRDLWNLSGVNGRCQDLRDGYGYLRSRYSMVWLEENRPYWLDNVLAQYDRAMHLWMQRGDSIRDARTQWHEQHTLPSPEQIGIPPQ